MLSIDRLAVENLEHGCVSDNEHPRMSFSTSSDVPGERIAQATLSVNGWTHTGTEQIAIPYQGEPLQPFTVYPVTLEVTDASGNHASAATTFETGRLGTPWKGSWISDPNYHFTAKKVSPTPMVFRKRLAPKQQHIKRARLYATAMGIYEFSIDGHRVGDQYFVPGFTSYATNLQYQTYDVTDLFKADGDVDENGTHTLMATVAGGWAVGSFVFTRKNRISADRQALLAELRLDFEDGTSETIATDESWEVCESGPYRMADIYDGETYDATMELGPDGQHGTQWHPAAVETLRHSPSITADYGSPVRAHEIFDPVSRTKGPDGETIYDMGQNFAGVVRLHIRKAHQGQRIIVRHAEILNTKGGLNTTFLRTAKATATYTCVDGEQTYMPHFTYMGFRYVSIEGIDPADIDVEGMALYSDLRRIGDFECSDARLNQLQDNIVWGAKSNLMDIPTDCPQRDERMGWTGDIAVFAPIACANFDMERFLEKWLRDVKAEQHRGGGIPNTVPAQGYGFPATMPTMAIDWWGDACVLVPWVLYQANGDATVLETMYPVMKKYVKACRFWAGLVGFGRQRYIWHTPSSLHFGDWVAPDVPKMSQWQQRSKWTATASLNNTSRTLAKVAHVLGHQEDADRYNALADKVADAYCTLLSDGKGRMKSEFQTAYVLPLYLHMFPRRLQATAAANLARLVKSNGYRIGTGFPGTPYILFALADNGQVDTAYRMLLNTSCPSWLYEVKMGATTIWERWDGLDENGECPIGDDGTDLMISYNHYASGAVGDFMYRRIAGIEPIEAGYRRFAVHPVPGGGLTYAQAQFTTPYGTIHVEWHIDEADAETSGENANNEHQQQFTIELDVPMGTSALVTLPDESSRNAESGHHRFSCGLTDETAEEITEQATDAVPAAAATQPENQQPRD